MWDNGYVNEVGLIDWNCYEENDGNVHFDNGDDLNNNDFAKKTDANVDDVDNDIICSL